MQLTERDRNLGEAELNARAVFPYYQWMRREGIPIHFAVAGVPDITAVERKPWPRTGKGLGATHQTSLRGVLVGVWLVIVVLSWTGPRFLRWRERRKYGEL